MNRSDLSYALQAVLPHAGTSAPCDVVGLAAEDGVLAVWATDRYTAAVATVPTAWALGDTFLSAKEARDLERYVRPVLVAHKAASVELGPSFPFTVWNERDREALEFDTASDGVSLDQLLRLFDGIHSQSPGYSQQVYDPQLLARFVKAQRHPTDRLRIYPRVSEKSYGTALVTVGDSFLAAVAGLSFDSVGEDPITSLLERVA